MANQTQVTQEVMMRVKTDAKGLITLEPHAHLTESCPAPTAQGKLSPTYPAAVDKTEMAG